MAYLPPVVQVVEVVADASELRKELRALSVPTEARIREIVREELRAIALQASRSARG